MIEIRNFFHLRASQRRRRNRIKCLRRADGQFVKDENEMASLALDFYKDLYRSKGTEDMDRVLDTVPMKIMEVMNELLVAPFSKEEIKTMLFQMFPMKAPGPDGFLEHFSSGTGICVAMRFVR